MQSIPAHYDGSRIVLDEATELRPDARLIVTVLPDAVLPDAVLPDAVLPDTQPEADPERADFMRLSEDALNRSYSDDEVEYSEADIKK